MTAPSESARKVSLLITTANLDHGGVEEVILQYVRGIDPARYDVTVGCLAYGRAAREIESLGRAKVVHIGSKSRLLRLLGFWRLARSVHADIVHNHACWYGLIAGLLAGSRRIETIHNVYVWFSPLQKFLYGMYGLLADRIIAVSEHVRTYSVAEIPMLRPERIVVIRNGIDVGKFAVPQETAALRAELGVPAHNVVAGFIGRLTHQKGVRYLIEAAADPALRGLPVSVVIVGEGELREELGRMCERLGVKNVVFTGYRRDIPRLMAMVDLFVLPSLWEGLPVSVLEASAAGRPVVATRVSGTAEVVIDGVTGFLVEPERSGELAGRIAVLASDPGLRAGMGKAARERATEHFSSERMIGETVKLYCEVAAR